MTQPAVDTSTTQPSAEAVVALPTTPEAATNTIPHLPREVAVANDRPLSISEVSELLGITAHTARYYERAGLIEVVRSQSGHRIYDQKTVERLDFLVRMRASGMGISELHRYVDLVRGGEATTPQRRQIMVAQRERIISQVHELELALATTDYKIAKYGGIPGDKASTSEDRAAEHDRTQRSILSSITHSEGDPS